MFYSSLAYPRFRTQVIGLFAGLATVLAAVNYFLLATLVPAIRAAAIASVSVLQEES